METMVGPPKAGERLYTLFAQAVILGEQRIALVVLLRKEHVPVELVPGHVALLAMARLPVVPELIEADCH